jgi:hypothetical protein
MSAPTRCLADLVDLTPPWLWPGRIPAAAITLLVGDPGQGKSVLTLDLAARVSAALPWPDGAPAEQPADVLLLAAEDSVAGAVRRRLIASGADLKHIHYLKSGQWSRHCQKEAPAKPTNGPIYRHTTFGLHPSLVADALARDAFHLTEALDALPHCRLVIIDPLPAYLASFKPDERDQLRHSLTPLMTLAERSGAAIVAVTHRDPALAASPTDARNPLTTLAAMARAIYLVDRVPGERRRRLLQTIKNNLADAAPSLAFDLTDAPGGAATLTWSETPLDDAEDAPPTLAAFAPTKAAPLRQFDRAVAWLEGALAAGPVLTADLEARAAKAGVSERTLRRARIHLRVNSFRQAAKNGGRWLCALPGQNCSSNDQVGQPKPLAELADLADLFPRENTDALLAKINAPIPGYQPKESNPAA